MLFGNLDGKNHFKDVVARYRMLIKTERKTTTGECELDLTIVKVLYDHQTVRKNSTLLGDLVT
jgi:hypothetical protein